MVDFSWSSVRIDQPPTNPSPFLRIEASSVYLKELERKLGLAEGDRPPDSELAEKCAMSRPGPHV